MNVIKQKQINVGDNSKFVGGDDNSQNHYYPIKQTKLSILFDKLREQFENGVEIKSVSDDFQRYTAPRDIIGLEEKLKAGNRFHLYEDASWLKQEFVKKMTLYQFYEPAQEIYSYLLGIICEKFRNIIYPLIRDNVSEKEISETLSKEIIDPIVKLIREEGCNDIMGLSSTEIEGMIYYLTGICHLKWRL